jgi:hypothetical protein
MGMTPEQYEAFRAECKAEGAKIDPQNCAVLRQHVQVLDPYGVLDLTDEEKCIGGDWFIRALPDGYWVWEHDVPADIVKAVQARELQEEWTL